MASLVISYVTGCHVKDVLLQKAWYSDQVSQVCLYGFLIVPASQVYFGLLAQLPAIELTSAPRLRPYTSLYLQVEAWNFLTPFPTKAYHIT